MALDWTKCSAVESVPGKVSGAWVFRGTRLPMATIFENLEDGLSIEEIMEQFERDARTGHRGSALCSTESGSSDSRLMLSLFGRWSSCSETLVRQTVPQFFSTFANVPTFPRNNPNQTSRARFKNLHSNPGYSVFLKKFTCWPEYEPRAGALKFPAKS